MLPSLFRTATIKDLLSFVFSFANLSPLLSVRAFCTSWTLYFLISARICFLIVLHSSTYSILLYCFVSCFISCRFLSIFFVFFDILSIFFVFFLALFFFVSFIFCFYYIVF